jgi:hypothetical protein
VDLPLPRLDAQPAGHQLEQEGAAMPVLLQGLARLLGGGLAPEPGKADKAARVPVRR